MSLNTGHELLSVGSFGSLSERLSKMRHDIRGSLNLIVTGCDLIRLKPDQTEKYLAQFSGKTDVIVEQMNAFSRVFEKSASLCDQISFILPSFKYGIVPGQRTSVSQALQAQAPEIAQLEETLSGARRAALEAALANPLDEAELRRRALRVAEIEIELTVLRAKAIAAASPPLSDRQKDDILRAALA